MDQVKITSIIVAIFSLFSPTTSNAQQKLYWSNASSIAPAIHCVDTSNGAGCVDPMNPTNTVLINLSPGLDAPAGIVIDEKNSKIIYANYASNGTITSCDLSGSNCNSIVTSLAFPQHLAIDPIREKLYWTASGGIYRSNLDGTSAGVISEITGSVFAGIAIDASAGRLFWVEAGSFYTIFESDITTVSPVNIFALQASDTLSGITTDESASRIYFSKISSLDAQLGYYGSYSSGSVFTSIIPILSGSNYYYYSYAAIDFPEANIFYGNNIDQSIYKTALPPTSPVQDTFISTAGQVAGLALSCGKYATDTDGDNSSDCREECINDALKTVPGICGCGTPDTDTDSDGTADCNDECDDDELKTSPGACGCGQEEPKGSCGCGLLEDINSDGKVVCVKTRQLAPNTKIEEPPIVEVEGDQAKITLEKFTKPTLTAKKKKKNNGNADITAFDFYDYGVEIKAKGLKVMYDVQVTKVGGTKKDIKKIQSKRNELTVKNLAPGNYNVKYRAVITQNGEPAAKTKYSPDANFTIQ